MSYLKQTLQSNHQFFLKWGNTTITARDIQEQLANVTSQQPRDFKNPAEILVFILGHLFLDYKIFVSSQEIDLLIKEQTKTNKKYYWNLVEIEEYLKELSSSYKNFLEYKNQQTVLFIEESLCEAIWPLLVAWFCDYPIEIRYWIKGDEKKYSEAFILCSFERWQKMAHSQLQQIYNLPTLEKVGLISLRLFAYKVLQKEELDFAPSLLDACCLQLLRSLYQIWPKNILILENSLLGTKDLSQAALYLRFFYLMGSKITRWFFWEQQFPISFTTPEKTEVLPLVGSPFQYATPIREKKGKKIILKMKNGHQIPFPSGVDLGIDGHLYLKQI